MTEAEAMADDVKSRLSQIRGGSLQLWGEFFGRPYDNFHRIVSCEATGDLLQLHFDEGEVLYVWSPRGLRVDQHAFRISDAAKVRWEWFYYGRPKTDGNRYFMEFKKDGAAISATTNVDWYKPDLRANPRAPSVELS